MEVKTKKGERIVKLTAAEGRVLDAAQMLCKDLGQLLGDDLAVTAMNSLGQIVAKYRPAKPPEPAATKK